LPVAYVATETNDESTNCARLGQELKAGSCIYRDKLELC